VTDPRPDLKTDSEEWTKLLTMAGTVNLELAGVLHGFRCCGLRLQKDNGYVLRPEFNSNTRWHNEAEYMADRNKWLAPFGREIIKLLDRLGGARAG
jgi:hypothetical protein